MDVPNWNRVYVKSVDDTIEVKAEYVYMSIPSEYMCTYMRLLTLMSDIGKQLLEDCNATCKGSGKNIVNCWNMFQSAVAAYQLGRANEANFLINYIEKQVANLYKVNGMDYNVVGKFPISSDGKVKAICSCGEPMKIEIETSDKEAYEEYELHKDDGKVFVMSNN